MPDLIIDTDVCTRCDHPASYHRDSVRGERCDHWLCDCAGFEPVPMPDFLRRAGILGVSDALAALLVIVPGGVLLALWLGPWVVTR